MQSTTTIVCPTEAVLEAFVTAKQNILNQLNDEKNVTLNSKVFFVHGTS